jgi:hypothetical protein
MGNWKGRERGEEKEPHNSALHAESYKEKERKDKSSPRNIQTKFFFRTYT